jgi:hypothetical protein
VTGMRALLALALTLGSTTARADDWPGAVPSGVASPDGKTVVRILPGDSLGDVVGFAGAKKGQPARAVFYRLEGEDRYVKYQEAKLLNPIAPVVHAVSNTGELVTLDNWHNMGYGKVVGVYAADGRLRRSYTLAELYSPEEIRRMTMSTSSIWWRCSSSPTLGPRSLALQWRDAIGHVLEANFATGAVTRTGMHKGC